MSSAVHAFGRVSSLRRPFVWALLVVLVLAFSPAPASARDAAAESFIRNVSNRIIKIMQSSVSEAEKRRQFSAIFSQHADVAAIGIFSLGRYARKLPQSRRDEYFRLMRSFISSTFSKHMTEIKGNRLDIRDSISRGGKDSIVRSTLHFATTRAPVKLNWRVVRRSSGLKIFNVTIDGLSLVQAQQSAFMSRVRDSGGNVNGLLSWLREAT